LNQLFGVAAVTCSFIAYAPYLKHMVTKRISPNPVTWLIWGVTLLTQFYITITQGAGPGAWSTLLAGLLSLVIAVYSFTNFDNKSDAFNKTNMVCIGILVSSMITLFLTESPLATLILLGCAALAGTPPTVVNVLNDYKSENLSMWILSLCGNVASLLAMNVYSFYTTFNVSIWLSINLSITALILIRSIKTGEFSLKFKKPNVMVRQRKAAADF